MSDQEFKPHKLVVIIVDRDQGKRLTKFLNSKEINFHLAALGVGTAPTEMRSYFGFGETEKTVLYTVVAEDRVSKLFAMLREEMGMDKPNSGIAFSLPIASFASKSVLKYLGAMDTPADTKK